jgi:hypothetical protein
VEIVIGTNTLFPFTALTPLHDLNQFHITMFASLLSFYMMLLDYMDASFFFLNSKVGGLIFELRLIILA